MSNSNPYYLHEQKEMNVYNRQQGRFNNGNPQPQNNRGLHDQYALANTIANNNSNPIIADPAFHNEYHNPQIGYEPPMSYPPLPYPSHRQNAQYVPYPPVPQYPAPIYQEYEQPNANVQGFIDHCPYCNKMTRSLTEQKPTKFAWFFCCLLLCTTGILFWLPFCFSCLKEKHIKCLNCSRTKFVIRNGC